MAGGVLAGLRGDGEAAKKVKGKEESISFLKKRNKKLLSFWSITNITAAGSRELK
jgi:hypothetical protein